MPRWTKAARKKHSELMKRLISEWKPWESSTGAKTPEGSARSSQNAKLKLTPEQEAARAQQMEIEALLISLKKQRAEIVKRLST
jgi:hypothetical protein